MRDFICLELLFCVASCSISVDTTVYRNLASQLTLEECRELVASLYYSGYELPANMDEHLVIIKQTGSNTFSATRSKTKNDACAQLLVEWDKKAGKNSTHIFIERRLRQMNKIEVADWLGKTVFHQLATDINVTLLKNPFADSNEELALNFKPIENKTLLLVVNDKLTRFDFVLRIFVIILFAALVVVCCKIVCFSYIRRNVKDNRVEEEMKNLLHGTNKSEN